MLVILTSFLLLFAGCSSSCVFANEIDIQKLANAIYRAEGVHSKHPYGILVYFKSTTPRQACIHTINHQLRIYKKQNRKEDFVSFLGRTYCPVVGATNDPLGLNKNWTYNVLRFYNG